MQGKKLLIIGKVWPEPNSSAAGKRMIQLITLFQEQDYKVEFATAANTTGFEEGLEKQGVEFHSIQLNDSSFEDFLADLEPDVVMFDRFMVEEQFGWRVRKVLPDTLTILDTEDLHFLRKGREDGVRHRGKFELSDYFNEFTKRELASILRTDLSLIISKFELELLIETFQIPTGKLFYLPIRAERSEVIVPFEDRNDVIFVGNFMHNPNWDAVLQLKKIWKAWSNKPKDIHLRIYGAYPPQKAFGLNSEKEQFHIMGRAESAEKVIGNAKLLIAPLRFGAGLKGKLIDSMALGTPTITTTIGAEGLGSADEWGGVVEDDFDKWPELIEGLFNNKAAWKESQEVGFTNLKVLSSADGFEELVRVVNELMKNLSLHRQQNFLGEVLHYHALRSTEFMSRWIEEKNKKAPTH